ncbi:MAG: serine hydrolase, partial [Vicinamibacterales bacterium]
MPRAILLALALLGCLIGPSPAAWPLRAGTPQLNVPYVPSPDRWERRRPSQVGMNEAALAAAVSYAQTRNSVWAATDYMADQVRTFGRPLGPVPPSHGPTNGLVVRRGYIVAEFGDTSAVEPSYSIAKSYLSTIAGLSVARGLIRDLGEPVSRSIHDGGYDTPHNARITWADHLRQASEWDGTMFGKRSTFVGREEFGYGEMRPRAIHEPG